jgi:long-subunit acyl-CoA synthetase (AMP-forming)
MLAMIQSGLWGQVGDKVAGVASAMASLGLGYKDRCGVYGANSPEWMITLQVTHLRLGNQQGPIIDAGSRSHSQGWIIVKWPYPH